MLDTVLVFENPERHQSHHLIACHLSHLRVAKLKQIKLNLIMNLEPSIHTPLTNEAPPSCCILEKGDEGAVEFVVCPLRLLKHK